MSLDASLTLWVNQALNGVWSGYAAWLAAEVLVALSVASLVFLWLRRAPAKVHHGDRKAVVLAVAAVAGVLAIKTVLAAFAFRERPFEALEGVLTLAGVKVDPASFPSAHSGVAAAIAVSLWLSGRKRLGSALAGIALAVAWGRVAIGVHYVSDVVAGLFLGAAIAWFLHHEGSELKRYLPD